MIKTTKIRATACFLILSAFSVEAQAGRNDPDFLKNTQYLNCVRGQARLEMGNYEVAVTEADSVCDVQGIKPKVKDFVLKLVIQEMTAEPNPFLDPSEQ